MHEPEELSETTGLPKRGSRARRGGRSWRPSLPGVIVALIAGAALNILVAWCLAVWTVEPRLAVGAEEVSVTHFPGPVPAPFDSWPKIRMNRQSTSWRTLDIYRADVDSKGGASLVYEVHTLGWPMPAMRRDFLFGSGVGGEYVASPESAGLTERGFVPVGGLGPTAAAVSTGTAKGKPKYFLPLRPDVLGFVINLPLYALLVLVLAAGARRVRGSVRAWRGRCRECGYVVGPLAVCPECGQVCKQERSS